jgi:hypothetical protein
MRSLDLRHDQYSAHLSEGASGAFMQVAGTISSEDPSKVLHPFVDAVHAELVVSGVKKVRVDVRPLEFVNSNGMKCFIRWVDRVKKLPASKQYELEFVIDPARRWQITAWKALSCFAPGQVRVRS